MSVFRLHGRQGQKQTCRRKRGHESREAAEEHMRYLEQQFEAFVTLKLSVYLCKACGKWHVNHGLGETL